MKFMMLVSPHTKSQGPPPKELMDAIAIISEEAVKNHTMLGNGGLAPIEQSTRVRVSKGQLTVTDGPYTEAKEVVGGYAQFETEIEGGGDRRGGALHGTSPETLARMGGRDGNPSSVRTERLHTSGIRANCAHKRIIPGP